MDDDDDDIDSRTASIARKRPREEALPGGSSAVHSTAITPRKRTKGASRQDARGFIPAGDNFSQADTSLGEENIDMVHGLASQQVHDGDGAAPSINWNAGSRTKIRTSLGGTKTDRQTSAQGAPPPRNETGTGRQAGQANSVSRSDLKDGNSSPQIVFAQQQEDDSPRPQHNERTYTDLTTDIALEVQPDEQQKNGPSSGRGQMETCLAIHNLAIDVTKDDIGQMLIPLSATTISLVESPRQMLDPAKHAIVDFADPSSAERARRVLTGKELWGRKIKVDYSQTPADATCQGSPQPTKMGASAPPDDQRGESSDEEFSVLLNLQSERGSGQVTPNNAKHTYPSKDGPVTRDFGGGSRETFEAGMSSENDEEQENEVADDAEFAPDGYPHFEAFNEGATTSEVWKPHVLADLSPEDFDLQMRYFYVTKDTQDIDRYSPVRCFVCTREGHVADNCDTMNCTHCGRQKDHFSKQCPQIKKCPKCREQGHQAQGCPYKLGRLEPSELRCDLCNRPGHIEDECELFWRTSGVGWEARVPMHKVRLSCYECGGKNHLGNDCSSRNPFKPMGSLTWSLFSYDTLSSQGRPKSGGTVIKGRASLANLPRRIDVVSISEEDEPANFYRPRIPEPSRQGSIRINTTAINETGHDWYRDSRNYEEPLPYRPTGHHRSRSPGEGGYFDHHEQIRGDGFDPASQNSHNGYAIRGRAEAANQYSRDKYPDRQVETYKPMPSAARGAWSKFRT